MKTEIRNNRKRTRTASRRSCHCRIRRKKGLRLSCVKVRKKLSEVKAETKKSYEGFKK